MHRFYHPENLEKGNTIIPEAETCKHIVSVLRHQVGDELEITNGKGFTAKCIITQANKKSCSLLIQDVVTETNIMPKLIVGIGFTRNNSRNEWLLEKITEFGVTEIIPLISDHSVKLNLRQERLEGILISAMLQSQKSWLPKLHPLTTFKEALVLVNRVPQKLIAHCHDDDKKININHLKTSTETALFIGPEGDFSQSEVGSAIENNFKTISLGTQRLRTETAAMAAVAFFRLAQE